MSSTSTSTSTSTPLPSHLPAPHAAYTHTHSHQLLHICQSNQQIAELLSYYLWSTSQAIYEQQSKSSGTHKYYTLAVSGGSLPALLSPAFTSCHYSSALQQQLASWHICYADERCVALNNQDSNHQLVQQHIIDTLNNKQQDDPTLAIALPHLYPINEALIHSPAQCAQDYQTRVILPLLQERYSTTNDDKNSISSSRGLDTILLGMGPDGHCASLFPSHALLKEEQLLVASITDSPKPPPNRITLTLPFINKAEQVIFVITGDKAKALHQVLDEPQIGLPASLVHAKQVIFLVDQQAASLLDKLKA